MSTIVHEGRSRIPVLYRDWTEWRASHQRSGLMGPAPLLPERTAFCATCWGAGRIYEAAGNGEGLVPRDCPWCGGLRTA